MQRLNLDLSKGLNRNTSDLAEPFQIARLPLWPKPGKNWSSHPGHDIVQDFPYDLTGATILRSDIAGNIAWNKDGAVHVANLAGGEPEVQGAADDGVFIPNLGWYRNRQVKIFLPNQENPSNYAAAELALPQVIAGSLDDGNYMMWAITFTRTRAGLFLTWYSYFPVVLNSNNTSGIKVSLTSEPGDNRYVRMYVQRQLGGVWGPLTFLAELTGGDKELAYTKHTQEGEATNLAIPNAKGLYAAGYNGRLFYQADKLAVIGVGEKPPTESVGGVSTPVQGIDSGYGYLRLDSLGVGVGATYSEVEIRRRWDASVTVGDYVYASIRYLGKTNIIRMHKVSLGISVLYQLSGEIEYLAAAASSSRIVFVGRTGACLVGNFDSDITKADSWSSPTLPSNADVRDVVWTGGEFAAVVDRGLLKGGNAATSWTLISPNTSFEPLATEWRHLVYAAGRYFIYGAQPIPANEWYHRIIQYDGNSWNSKEFSLPYGPSQIGGIVLRRFSMLTVQQGLVVVGHGVKGQGYHVGLGIVSVPELDWFIYIKPEDFSVSSYRSNAFGTPPFGPDLSQGYGRWLKPDSYNGVVAFATDTDLKLINTNVSGFAYNRQTIGFNGAAYGTSFGASFIASGTSIVDLVYGGGTLYTNTRTISQRGAYAEGSVFNQVSVYGGLYVNRMNLRLISDAINTGIPYTNLLDVKASGSVDAAIIATREAGGSGQVLNIRAGKRLDALALVGTETGYTSLQFEVRARGSKVYYWAYGSPGPSVVGTYDTSTPSTPATRISGSWGAIKNLVFSGTNGYFITTNESSGSEIRNLTGTVVYSESGVLLGGADGGTGKIYVARKSGTSGTELDILEVDTSTWTVTYFGNHLTLPTVPTRVYGAMAGGSTKVLHFVVAMAGGYRLYVYDPGTNAFQQVLEKDGPITIITGSGGGSTGGAEAGSRDIKLPSRSIVWTEPGYVNVASSFSYTTLIPRASKEITEIVPHPAGVMVFLDNETYVMQGRFSSITDTRVAPYPSTIGHDKGKRLAVVGSTVYPIWGGRVWALENNPVPISYAVDDGTPYRAVAYDLRNNMLAALRENGEVFRYDLIRKVWFNDMEGADLIFETANGVYYLRGGRVYKVKPWDEDPTANYYRIPQEMWLDAVKLQGEEIKRIRMMTLDMRSEGPPMPHITISNEANVAVLSMNMKPTIQSNTSGLGRYRALFPPVVTYALSRVKIAFGGGRFDMAPMLEVAYDSHKRKV